MSLLLFQMKKKEKPQSLSSVAETVGCSQGGAGAADSGAGKSSTDDADDTTDDEARSDGPELEDDSEEGGAGYGHGEVVGTSSVGAYWGSGVGLSWDAFSSVVASVLGVSVLVLSLGGMMPSL